MEEDIFRTAAHPSAVQLYKEKGSKFYAVVYPVQNEDEVKNIIAELKKEYHSARHWCYAYQIGTTATYYRANDDGEPSNSAGMPIYGQIQAFNLTNVLVAVVRYFGGIKLGVGGLMSAYKTAAKMALEQTEVIEMTINDRFLIQYDYSETNKVMRIIKEHQAQIISHNVNTSAEIIIEVRKKLSSRFASAFKNLHFIILKPLI